MFHGSIPGDMQRILHQLVGGWRCQDVYVGCSGNFTVERVLAEAGRFRLHGNDVTLYSSVLGWFFAGDAIEVTLNPEREESFGWLRPYLRDRAGTAATVMLATRLAASLSAAGEVKQNAYWERILQAQQDQWSAVFEMTKSKLERSSLRLASYHCGDVAEWIKGLPQQAGFICYPPFFGAGRAYERDFAKLEMLFSWERPHYEPLTDERLQAFYDAVGKRQHWIFGTNQRLEQFEPHLRGMTQTTNRGKIIYLYASGGPTRIVVPRQATEPVTVPRLLPGQEIGEVMTLAVLSNEQFHALRSQYMNIGIRPGSASLALAVLADGVLIGVFAFSAAPHVGAFADPSRVYLLSDFPVEPVDYVRLSKLVLYAALSREAKLLAERLVRRRVRSAYTTAFSNRPASMKYRGLFKLHSRKENPVAKADWGRDIDLDISRYYRQRYELNYIAPMGEWTLAEGLAEWKGKHGGRAD